jgi:XTP/dITP diphosphohydrolase
MKSVYLVTHSKKKLEEISEIAQEFNVQLEMPKNYPEKFEIQADSVQEVSKFSALTAYEKLKVPLVVDDSGLFVDALKGFPGVYSAYVLVTLGNSGILKLMNGISNRKAYVECCASFCDANGVKSFNGRVDGTILDSEKGELGFGFDPIFTPDGHNGKSLAELDMTEKNNISHRGKAFKAFFEWYSK